MNRKSNSISGMLTGIAEDVGRIAEMLAEQGEATCRCLPSPGLRVSEQEGRVFWNGGQLPINGNRDLALFLMVYRARGEIVSQAELLRKICPGSISDQVTHLYEPATEVKEALRHVRQACREIGAPDFIEVVRGRGYRLRNLTK